MSKHFTPELKLLIRALDQMGFVKITDTQEERMLDHLIIYALKPIKIHLWREVSMWFVQFSEDHFPDKRHCTDHLRNAMGLSDSIEEMEVADEAIFWPKHWEEICRFFENDANEAHAKIDRTGLELSKRRHPEWYGE